MTENARKRFYFPIWNGCCKALGWRMVCGRLDRGEPGRMNEHALKVLAAADARATAQARAADLSDLRHGVTIVALGRDKDTNSLTPREIDQVTALMKLMQEAVNLEASMLLDDAGRSERAALVARIHSFKAPPNVIDEVCRHSYLEFYDGQNWGLLPIKQLRGLMLAVQRLAEEYAREVLAAENAQNLTTNEHQ